jgi:UDP:flavonoid glycosyltransferase YjiC (YdhE family)
MGNGSISYRTQLSVLKEAFYNSPCQVYIASYQAEPVEEGNIHTARRFDFNTLLPQAAAFINHGGQNSVLSGIMSAVPQIVFPGNVFERQYNADSIERLNLGKRYADAQFTPSILVRAVQKIRDLPGFAENTYRLQDQLTQLGGVDRAIQCLSTLCPIPQSL